MTSEEPAFKKRLLDTGQDIPQDKKAKNLHHCIETTVNILHSKIEECYPLQCLCSISGEDLQTYIQLNQTTLHQKEKKKVLIEICCM